MSPSVTPHRYFIEVAAHIAGSLHARDLGTSQILLIGGPPGAGKTYNLFSSLETLGIDVVAWDAMHVESAQANQPLERLDAAIRRVRSNISRNVVSALVMDDVDLLLGRYDGVQYTHNLQHLVQHLMLVSTGRGRAGEQGVPCPIFFCANDESILHGPLVRLGRARSWEWIPTHPEMIAIVHAIFYHLGDNDVEWLLSRFSGQLPAFYSALREEAYATVFRNRASQDSAAMLREGLAVANGGATAPGYEPSVQLLVEIGDRLLADRSARGLVETVEEFSDQGPSENVVTL